MNIRKRSLQLAPLALASLVLLTGCDGNVSTVKDQIYPEIDSSMRLGKALETRTDCEHGKWDSYSDERGRDVVSYTCTLPQLYLDTFKNNELAKHDAPQKSDLDKRISTLINRKNDTPRVRDYLLAHYDALVTLNATNKGALQEALYTLFFNKLAPETELSADGTLPLPSRETTDQRCQQLQFPSCEEYYNTIVTMDKLFNGLMQVLDYKTSYSYLLLPYPGVDRNEAGISPESESANDDLLGHFYDLMDRLLNSHTAFPSSDEIAQRYTALIPQFNAEIDKEIAEETTKFNQRLQGYNLVVSNATFTSVQETFYWYINDNGDPVDSGGTLMFTRNGKSETVRMKDRDDYLAVAYQSFPSDRIPNIYLNAMGAWYYNAWLINSQGGI